MDTAPAALREDIGQYYADHSATLELFWVGAAAEEVSFLVQHKHRLVERRRRWNGMMVVSSDREHLYLRTTGIPPEPNGVQLTRIPWSALPEDLRPFCLEGILHGMAQIKARKLWKRLDFAAREYDIIRRTVSPLVRRAILRQLLNAVAGQLREAAAPLLERYRHGAAIAARLVDTVLYLLIEIEYPHEQKALAELKERFLEELSAAGKREKHCHGIVGVSRGA